MPNLPNLELAAESAEKRGEEFVVEPPRCQERQGNEGGVQEMQIPNCKVKLRVVRTLPGFRVDIALR